jgi:hypothetical protein
MVDSLVFSIAKSAYSMSEAVPAQLFASSNKSVLKVESRSEITIALANSDRKERRAE